jgi:pimeloyl-ACP methyl ester carboxylesterase
MRALLLAVVATLCAGLGATSAQAANAIEAAYAVAGPSAVATASGTDANGIALQVFYPANLGVGGTRAPVITWGNGSFATPAQYTGLLNQLASWGFVVVASTDQSTGTGSEMLAALDWMEAQDAVAGSPFQGKLDLTREGAIGHSQGAGGTVNATNHSGGRIDTAVTIALPAQLWVSPGDAFAVASLAVPTFFLGGANDILIAGPTTTTGYYNAKPGAAAKAILKGADHNTIQGTGGGFLGYITAWMRYQLAGDTTARGAFVGSPPELTTNTAWSNAATKSLP